MSNFEHLELAKMKNDWMRSYEKKKVWQKIYDWLNVYMTNLLRQECLTKYTMVKNKREGNDQYVNVKDIILKDEYALNDQTITHLGRVTWYVTANLHKDLTFKISIEIRDGQTCDSLPSSFVFRIQDVMAIKTGWFGRRKYVLDLQPVKDTIIRNEAKITARLGWLMTQLNR